MQKISFLNIAIEWIKILRGKAYVFNINWVNNDHFAWLFILFVFQVFCSCSFQLFKNLVE